MKAVIVGCGAITDRWARVLTADPRVEVVAVVDPDLDRAEQLAARRCPAAVPATSLGQAHARVRADMVANLTPPQLHAAVSREALAAGLHVLTEKPLALQVSAAAELAELARTNRRALAVMHNRAQDPRFLAFAGKVAATELALPFLGAHCGLAAITATFIDGSVLCYRGGYAGRGLATTAVGTWRVDGPDLAARWEPPPDQPSSVQPPATSSASPPWSTRCRP